MAFDPTQIKSATGNRGTYDPNSPNILEQQTRATFSPRANAHRAGQNADLSRFARSGHFFPLMLPTLSARRPEQIVKTGRPRWMVWAHGRTVGRHDPRPKAPISRALGRSVEQYFFEGKAPSVELRGVFDRFRMLTSVYSRSSLPGHARELTPGQAGQRWGTGELGQSAPVPRENSPGVQCVVSSATAGGGRRGASQLITAWAGTCSDPNRRGRQNYEQGAADRITERVGRDGRQHAGPKFQAPVPANACPVVLENPLIVTFEASELTRGSAIRHYYDNHRATTSLPLDRPTVRTQC